MNNIPSNTKTYLCMMLEENIQRNKKDNIYTNLKEFKTTFSPTNLVTKQGQAQLMGLPLTPKFSLKPKTPSSYKTITSPSGTTKIPRGQNVSPSGGAGIGLTVTTPKLTGIEPEEDDISRTIRKYGLGPTSDATLADVGQLYALGAAGDLAGFLGSLGGRSFRSMPASMKGKLGRLFTTGPLAFMAGSLGSIVSDITGKSWIDANVKAMAEPDPSGMGSPFKKVQVPRRYYY